MPFRFDKFTIKAQEGVQRAVELAASRGNPQTTPVHLLQALVSEQEGIVRPLFEKIGVDRGHLERIIEAELSHFPKVSGGAQPQPDSRKPTRSRGWRVNTSPWYMVAKAIMPSSGWAEAWKVR